MIELYEGRLGGGKTYSAVVRMVDHLRRGGFVCTNISVIRPAISAYVEKRFGVIVEDDQLLYLPPEQIGLFHRFTPSGTAELPVLVVIDEAHLTFNARDFAQTDKLYRETLTFLTQSRKVATDIIFIAQSVLNMDKQFMRLVQFIWRFRDLAKWKIPGLGIPYPLKQILAVQFDYDGRTILQRQFVRKDPAIFSLYHTDHIVKPFPRLEMAKTNRTLAKSEKKGPMVKYLIPLGIIAGLIAAFVLVKNFRANSGASEIRSVNTTSLNPISAVTKEKDKEKGQYDIYAESFVAWNGFNKALQTNEGGWYQVGEMSAHGYVTAISDRRAKIAQPDGRTGWVVANRDFKPVALPSAVPIASGTPKQIIIAHDPAQAASPTPEPSATPTAFPISKQR